MKPSARSFRPARARAVRGFVAGVVLAVISCMVGMVGMTAAVAAQGAVALTVDQAWARATVPGQTAGAAFMRLSTPDRLDVVSVATPVAGVAALHEMAMAKGVMSMRPIQALHLEPGAPTLLTPDGVHIMLFDLKAPLAVGQHFPLRLGVRAADGTVSEKTVDVEVKPLTYQGPGR